MAPEQDKPFDEFELSTTQKHTQEGPKEIDDIGNLPLKIPESYRNWVNDQCRLMDIDRLREKGARGQYFPARNVRSSVGHGAGPQEKVATGMVTSLVRNESRLKTSKN